MKLRNCQLGGKTVSFGNAYFVHMRRISVLSLFSFRKFVMNQDFISDKQVVWEEGRRVEVDLLDR